MLRSSRSTAGALAMSRVSRSPGERVQTVCEFTCSAVLVVARLAALSLLSRELASVAHCCTMVIMITLTSIVVRFEHELVQQRLAPSKDHENKHTHA